VGPPQLPAQPSYRRCCHPQGSLGERLSSYFLGGNPRLVQEEVVHSCGDRFRLQTVARWVVQLQLGERQPLPGCRGGLWSQWLVCGLAVSSELWLQCSSACSGA
jgi:hypothetical protein